MGHDRWHLAGALSSLLQNVTYACERSACFLRCLRHRHERFASFPRLGAGFDNEATTREPVDERPRQVHVPEYATPLRQWYLGGDDD